MFVQLRGLHIPATRWIWILSCKESPDRCDTCAICRTAKVPVFSPHQARWYSWSSHTTKNLKIMSNPLSNLQLDVWYKVVIVICTVVFLSTAGGLLPKLPTNSALLISLGGVFFAVVNGKTIHDTQLLKRLWARDFLALASSAHSVSPVRFFA